MRCKMEVSQGQNTTGQNAISPVIFSIQAHNSLSSKGFAILMAFIGSVSLVVGLYFTSLGGWPILGFFGLEFILVYGAFRLSFYAARKREEIIVSEQSVTVNKIAPNGRVDTQVFQTAWLKLELRPCVVDEELPGDLLLSSHGRTTRIGYFLSPDERETLAKALAKTLHEMRVA
ncbi:DUF2244 domain-containing protein [Alphaproteobacteria bacterium]|nr:DUF2244 domain-containing protein [Alphaproteobacteria bacterium]